MLTLPSNLARPSSGGGGDLQAAILARLAGSCSQRPVDLEELYRLGSPNAVRGALLELYAANLAQTCLITRNGVQRGIWWETGNTGRSRYSTYYGQHARGEA